MNLCGLPTAMRKKPKNLIHVVFDNGIYESSGGTKTAAADGLISPLSQRALESIAPSALLL
jgi:thiamine pyrophosphate-dependent acetolactate synthase large subunit-like protein